MANAHYNAPPQCQKNGLPLDLDLYLCVKVLGIGVSVKHDGPCCRLIGRLVKLQANVCLCAIADLDILGLIDVRADIKLEMLLSRCELGPKTFNCE
ncbi:hypothetical protein PTKIN_Ptkin04bG0206700 [Pterospermum kingtungense]